MEIKIISPQSQVTYHDVSSLIICSVVGWINILPYHSFMIVQIVVNTMTIITSAQTHNHVHTSGFLLVHNNKIIITLSE